VAVGVVCISPSASLPGAALRAQQMTLLVLLSIGRSLRFVVRRAAAAPPDRMVSARPESGMPHSGVTSFVLLI
jgi:hypothetical protein